MRAARSIVTHRAAISQTTRPSAGAGPVAGHTPPRQPLYWWRLDTLSEGAEYETSAGDGDGRVWALRRMNNEARAENSNVSRSREEMILLGFVRGFLVWFVVYMFLQGQDGFFAVTIERVQSTWMKLLFLNIPVQLILTIIASFGLTKGQLPARTRFGLAIAIVNAVLIIVHIGLSMMTA